MIDRSKVISIQQQFMKSLESGDVDEIRKCISAGADVNLRGSDPEGETPLMRATAAGNLRVVRLLIAAGADVNRACIIKGSTPLMLALENPVVMQALIAAGADVNARTHVQGMISPINGKRIRRGGETALHLAAAANNAEAVKILVQAGAEIEACAENGLAPLDYALKVGSPTDASVALVEAGAKLTPQRFEVMNSEAHDPESDIWEFPWTTEPDSPGDQSSEPPMPDDEKPAATQITAKTPNPEFRCPNCQALLYTHRSRMCGNCGAVLPPELFVSREEARIKAEQERKWARDLANAFSPEGYAVEQHTPEINPRSCSPAEFLRRTDFVEQFRKRPRPPLPLYLLGAALITLTAFFLFLQMGRVQPIALVLIALPLVLSGFTAWQVAKPFCPSCRQNIQTCSAVCCVSCGGALHGGRCKSCSADYSGRADVWPFTNSVRFQRIKYCPGCGVFLDTPVRFGTKARF